MGFGAWSVAWMLIGVVLSWVVCYFLVVRPARAREQELVDIMLKMRREGYKWTEPITDWEPEQAPDIPEW